MKRILRSLLVLLTIGCVQPAHADRANPEANPHANPEAIVQSGNARFTVLTPSLIRLEWSADGIFEDDATLGIIHRHLPVPDFSKRATKSKVVIRTEQLTLTYLPSEGPFTAENLWVEFLLEGKKQIWKPGMEQTGNLLGTCRTLDGCNGERTEKITREPLEIGILSRDGWALIDESNRHVLRPDSSRWGEWVECRAEGERQDLYLFAYGHRYREALKDFTLVAGRVPLPPKFAFGYWWSRYWEYSDQEIRDLVRTIRSFDIPMDVMVIDMDWHETWGLNNNAWRDKSLQDVFGQPTGWTGYTWQKELFPNPENLFTWLRKNNLKSTLNIHPASGIRPFESVYEAFCEAYEWDKPGEAVPYRLSEQKWADAWFKTVLNPIEDMGMDFWWTDWQQWRESKYCKGLSNTFWLNYCEFNDMAIRDNSRRPIIYHRWGGLGSHRYQIAFSGDTYINWATLGYLPYFTATASNVCYGYWGHDLGGHMNQKSPTTDPELYTRWIQYGVFTPIFKTHGTKSAAIERSPWKFPDHLKPIREAIRLRYSLSPYIYTMAREATDTGVSICRPMYYDYPEQEEAYRATNQYLFGNDILATAIASPADTASQLSSVEVWFPEGEWYDMATGRMIRGGKHHTLHYTIHENPWYVKAGAIIPMASEEIMNLQEPSTKLVLTVAPGGSDSQTTLYEDDGTTNRYTEEYSTTRISKEFVENGVRITIHPSVGHWEGISAERDVEVRLESTFAPQRVEINGREVRYARYPEAGEWSYNGEEFATVVLAGSHPRTETLTITCYFDPTTEARKGDVYGQKGLSKRCAVLSPEFKIVKSSFSALSMLPVEYLRVACLSSFANEDPQRLPEFLDQLQENMPLMREKVGCWEELDANFRTKLDAWVSTF